MHSQCYLFFEGSHIGSSDLTNPAPCLALILLRLYLDMKYILHAMSAPTALSPTNTRDAKRPLNGFDSEDASGSIPLNTSGLALSSPSLPDDSSTSAGLGGLTLGFDSKMLILASMDASGCEFGASGRIGFSACFGNEVGIDCIEDDGIAEGYIEAFGNSGSLSDSVLDRASDVGGCTFGGDSVILESDKSIILLFSEAIARGGPASLELGVDLCGLARRLFIVSLMTPINPFT